MSNTNHKSQAQILIQQMLEKSRTEREQYYAAKEKLNPKKNKEWIRWVVLFILFSPLIL